jgi:hypothetical protein
MCPHVDFRCAPLDTLWRTPSAAEPHAAAFELKDNALSPTIAFTIAAMPEVVTANDHFVIVR